MVPFVLVPRGGRVPPAGETSVTDIAFYTKAQVPHGSADCRCLSMMNLIDRADPILNSSRGRAIGLLFNVGRGMDRCNDTTTNDHSSPRETLNILIYPERSPLMIPPRNGESI